MRYVPLTHAWGADGCASVLFAALEDAGFHPVIETDPRGPMHYYGWPLGSSDRITIWIPQEELEDGRAFLAAAQEITIEPAEVLEGFSGRGRSNRRWIFLGWLLGVAEITALFVGAVWLVRLRSRVRPTAR